MAPLTFDPALLGGTTTGARASVPIQYAASEALPEAHIVLSYPIMMQSAPEPVSVPASGSGVFTSSPPLTRSPADEVQATPRSVLAARRAPALVGALETPSPGPVSKGRVQGGSSAEAVPATTLDMAGLKARLRDTGGIGLLTKLALKNQVDDLIKQFREHHDGHVQGGVASLRQPYNLLVLKVLSLLQDTDPALARTLSGSREAIWDILSDPQKFRASS